MAESKAPLRQSSEAQAFRIDGIFEAAVHRNVRTVDPPCRVGAQEQNDGCNILRPARATDAIDVTVDACVAEHSCRIGVSTGPGLTALTRMSCDLKGFWWAARKE